MVENLPPPGFEPESPPRKGRMIGRTTPQGRVVVRVSSFRF